MKNLFKLALALLAVSYVLTAPVLAQEAAGEGEHAEAAAASASYSIIPETGAVGAGIIILGAAYGIGKLASASFESMARQPEVANTIRGAMIIAAALIEGATFFALVVCIIQIFAG